MKPKDRRWISMSKEHHDWITENGNLLRNHRSYDDVVGDLIKFFEAHSGIMPIPRVVKQ